MNFIYYRAPQGQAEIFEVGEARPFTSSDLRKRIILNNLKTHPDGFVAAPFSPSELPLFYPVVRPLQEIPPFSLSSLPMREKWEFPVMNFQEYKNYISAIKEELDNDLSRKVVASRRTRMGNVQIDSQEKLTLLFKSLCRAYPDAYIFIINTEDFGLWFGASPELLIEKKGCDITTMSLAGTRLAGTQEDWDEKNLREQSIVTAQITDLFHKYGLDPRIHPVRTHSAGPIEHLKTIINAKAPKTDITGLIKELSPTPALAGYPLQVALEIIRRYEGDRKLYGGYFGPIYGENFTFNVILRCAFVEPDSEIVLFAGGGITCLSDPESEWIETERKIRTLLPFLS